MKYKYILFDLDGTLSESAPGVRSSLEHALNTLDKPLPALDNYTAYIGPPLISTFKNLCGLNEEDCEKALLIYRDYYDKKGKYLNKLYEGMYDVLDALKSSGARLAVCTSKYEKFAGEIISILGVEKVFDAVCGATLDNLRKEKKDLIPYAVKALGGDFEAEKQSVVMIGDTRFDAEGALLCGVDFVGVTFGYGDVSQMRALGAKDFANTAAELQNLLII